jgi:hypothetical protein
MRYLEFKTLLEYDRSKTVASLGAAIQKRAESDAYLKSKGADPVEAVLAQAEEADPTANKQYVVWIVQQFIKQGLKYEDIYKLRDDLDVFVNTKVQHKRLGIKSDINQYDWRTLANTVAKLNDTTMAFDTADTTSIKDTEVLHNGPLGILSVPKTREASCALGGGTKWCTAAADEKKNMYSHYAKYGPLYVWNDKKRKDKFQFHFDTGQFMDARDKPLGVEDARYFIDQNPITKQLFEKKQGAMDEVLDQLLQYVEQEPEYDSYDGSWGNISPTELQEMILEANFVFLLWKESGKELVRYYRKAAEYISPDLRKILLSDETKRNAFESAYIKNPRDAQTLADKFYQAPTPHLEDIIAQDGGSAYLYAFNTLKQKRFEKGEPEIAKNAWAAAMYAQKVLKQPWPAGEPAIKQSSATWRSYQQFFNLI